MYSTCRNPHTEQQNLVRLLSSDKKENDTFLAGHGLITQFLYGSMTDTEETASLRKYLTQDRHRRNSFIKEISHTA